MTVAVTRVESTSFAGMVMMSRDSTTKSANLPVVIEPRMSSVNEAYAGSIVMPAQQPPGSVPGRHGVYDPVRWYEQRAEREGPTETATDSSALRRGLRQDMETDL